MELTDKQWTRLEPIILQPMCKKDSSGRKPGDPGEVLNGILWVLRTGAQRMDFARSLPPKIPAMDKDQGIQAHY